MFTVVEGDGHPVQLWILDGYLLFPGDRPRWESGSLMAGKRRARYDWRVL